LADRDARLHDQVIPVSITVGVHASVRMGRSEACARAGSVEILVCVSGRRMGVDVDLEPSAREVQVKVYEERHDRRYEHMSGGSFSPDGTKITFTHGNALVVFDLVQRREEVLLEMPHLEGARWSPTGEVIAFQGGPDHRGIYNLYFFRLRDKKVSLVVEQEIGPGGSQFAWRRDGKGLVFEDLKRNIWMLDLDTSQRQHLGNGHFPSWSPDGRYIAYGTEQEDFLYDLTTGQKRTLFAGEEVLGALVWSPDSRYVVYAKPRFLPRLFGKMSGSLWVTDLQTGTTVPLYSEGPNIGPVDWVAGVPASVGN